MRLWVFSCAVAYMLLSLRADPAVAQEPVDERPRLDERTAFTVGAQRLKLGVLAFEYGITERLSVGTDPPAWAVRTVLPIWVLNLHAELRLLEREPLALSLRAGGYHADVGGGGGASGSLLSVPASAFASVAIAPRVLLHTEGTYVFVDAFGAGDLDNADANGAVATRVAQAGAMLEYRLSRVASLTARGRYQVYSGPLALRGSGQLDAFTTARVEAELTPRELHPWQAVGGVALLWRRVQLLLGAGYGHYFIPGFEIALPEPGFVPEFSFAVVL